MKRVYTNGSFPVYFLLLDKKNHTHTHKHIPSKKLREAQNAQSLVQAFFLYISQDKVGKRKRGKGKKRDGKPKVVADLNHSKKEKKRKFCINNTYT